MVSGSRALGFAICAASVLWVGAARAGTILILNPTGDGGPDIGFDGTVLATLSDGDVSTTGDQDTVLDFVGLSIIVDPFAPPPSFTLSGLTASGPASVFGTLVVQNFVGGSLAIYDPADALLLAGTLTSSALSATLGPPGTGGLFTTTFATVTGGSLMPLIEPGSLSISVTLSDVNGGDGMSVSPGGALQGFEADSVVALAANLPEPALAWLLGVGAAALIGARSRLRSIE